MNQLKVVVGCLLAIGLIWVAFFGGWARLFVADEATTIEATTVEATTLEQDKDPLQTSFAVVRACADGTAYLVANGSLFWLVGDQCLLVACEDAFYEFGSQLLVDPRGGVYLMGQEHLWYVYQGKAAQVHPVPEDAIMAATQPASEWSRRWSALHTYGESAYDFGYQDGLADATDD